VRKLATAAAVSLALASGGAFGLGLGEIEMQSALNQPMDAEIPLTSVQPGELEGMIVQLASPQAFAQAGVERSPALNDLQFTVDQSSGTPVIRVVSGQPVTEPFLNFLIDVQWQTGQMVREYTVLLDPPVFLTPSASERNTNEDQLAVAGGDAASVVPTPIERSNVAVDDPLDGAADAASADEGVLVDLSDLEDISADPIPSLDEVTSTNSISANGESVSLDELSDESLIPGSAGEQGDVVSLTDLSAPNLDAQAERLESTIDRFTLDDIEVQAGAPAEEVPDDVVIGEDGLPVSDELEDGSTIVSLEDLEAPAQPSTSVGSGTAASQVTVGPGDTLFEIAQDNLTAGASVQQMMLAILAANEAGFIDNNINLVRAGTILRVPETDDVTTLTQEEALAAISDQNQLWQDYRDNLRSSGATQVVQNNEAAEPDDLAEGEDPAESDALVTAAVDDANLSEEAREILDNARAELLDREELRIVADEDTTSTAASATADETTDTNTTARIGEINRQLRLAREELSSASLRTEDLGDQASELSETEENLDALVVLRQNEVARLQAS